MEKYLNFKTTNNLKKDIETYFLTHNKLDTFKHTIDVVNELYNIQQFGYMEKGSEIACYCHDLGRVVDEEEMVDFCIKNNIEVTDEEKQHASILHQKISEFIAKNVFKIKDDSILNAIRYHSTSRAQSTKIEMEVLLADKLSWKEDSYEKFVNELRETIKESKEKAILYYLTYLESNKEELLLYHRDSKEAYRYYSKEIIC